MIVLKITEKKVEAVEVANVTEEVVNIEIIPVPKSKSLHIITHLIARLTNPPSTGIYYYLYFTYKKIGYNNLFLQSVKE